MDDAIDLVLGKLDGVRQQGGYWMARCPAHEDGTQSLSVKRGTEQPVLLNCFVGCETTVILDAIGLTVADISAPREEQQDRVVAEYRYTDEHGNLLFVKERRVPKDFRLKRPDGHGGWAWTLGDTRRVMYNLPAVLRAIADGGTVYLVEGEKDADAVGRNGAVATCNFEGAAKEGQRAKWRPEYGDVLKGAHVIIVADKDEAGRAHAAAAAADLEGKAASVHIAEAAEGKDVSDHFAAGRSLDELVRPAKAGAFEVIDLEPATEIVLPPVLICADKLYLGAVHTLTGPPDCGKTTLACWWMLQAIRDGRTVLFLDEEGGRELVTEKFQTLGAQPGERIAYISFPGRGWNLADVADLADLMEGRHPALVTWDSSAAFLARAGLDENAAADVTRFYSQVLIPCARQYGAAVLVIDHDTKDAEPSRYARGSGAKLAAADVAYKVEMVKAFSKTENGSSRLAVTKDRRGWLHRSHEVAFTAENPLSIDIKQSNTTPGEFRPTHLMGKICEVLINNPDSSAAFIKARVHGRERHIAQALAVLVDEGHVTVRKGSHNSQLHTLEVPFNE